MTDSSMPSAKATVSRSPSRHGRAWLLGLPAALAIVGTIALGVAVRLHSSSETIIEQYESQATRAAIDGRYDVAQLCQDRVRQVRENERQ